MLHEMNENTKKSNEQMFQRMEENMNKNRREDKEEIIKSLKEDNNKNIESLKKDITEKIDDNGKKLEIFQEENKKSIAVSYTHLDVYKRQMLLYRVSN